jgi:predicted deacylase
MRLMRKPFVLASIEVAPGSRRLINVPMPDLSSQTSMSMPVHVVHGRQPGPVQFVSAAIHGDELNGIEIIRQILATKAVSRIRGTLIAIPVVNAYGLIQVSRYLPDRRDLNRVFPGSDNGSLAARLARLFVNEIVSLSTHGIDLHTGSGHRTNLPQIRANLDDPETERLAKNFGVPVLLNAS